MKKIIYIFLIGILSSINLNANENIPYGKLKKIPLNISELSFENGGSLNAIDAFYDGIGVVVSGEEDKKIIAMNELVYKYGEEAKKNNQNLKDYVTNNGNNTEKDLANLLGTNNSVLYNIGDPCNDNNNNTINDIYIDTNGTCLGTIQVVKNTVKCKGDPIGSEFIVDGISYLVVDNNTLRNSINDTWVNMTNLRPVCTSNVTDMYDLFAYTDLALDINNWDVSNVVTMERMFNGSTFNGDISSWDISKVENMQQMFELARFNGNINNWNVSNVKNMNWMFAFTNNSPTGFNQDISSWDTSNVTSMNGMFRSSNFNQNISSWNVSKVTNMNYMFNESPFNFNLNSWNVSTVTTHVNFGLDSSLVITNYPNFLN